MSPSGAELRAVFDELIADATVAEHAGESGGEEPAKSPIVTVLTASLRPSTIRGDYLRVRVWGNNGAPERAQCDSAATC